MSDKAKQTFYEHGVLTMEMLRKRASNIQEIAHKFNVTEREANLLLQIPAKRSRRRNHCARARRRQCNLLDTIDDDTLLEKVREVLDDTEDAQKQTQKEQVELVNSKLKAVTQRHKQRVMSVVNEIQRQDVKRLVSTESITCPSISSIPMASSMGMYSREAIQIDTIDNGELLLDLVVPLSCGEHVCCAATTKTWLANSSWLKT